MRTRQWIGRKKNDSETEKERVRYGRKEWDMQQVNDGMHAGKREELRKYRDTAYALILHAVCYQ